MGLDFYPVCGERPHWSYIGFDEFRTRLAKQVGLDLDKMEGFGGKVRWEGVKDDIVPLLNHSDCDGILSPDECNTVAKRLTQLVKDWPDNDYDKMMALRLVSSMTDAFIQNIPLEFC